MERRRKELLARQAGLDVQREKAISRRQAELYKIQQRIADFEVEAVAARIDGARRARAAEDAYQDLDVKWVREGLARYQYHEKNFTLPAPHDGVVRHAFNSNERRKTQKGDAFSAGQRVVSLARDATLAAHSFVPEHRLAEIAVGATVIVTSTASAEGSRPRSRARRRSASCSSPSPCSTPPRNLSSRSTPAPLSRFPDRATARFALSSPSTGCECAAT